MACACLCVVVAGVAVCLSMPGQLSWSLRATSAAACFIAAATALFLVLRARKTIWLHISATGQIRVVEHLISSSSARAKPQVMKAGLAQLLAGTTIWPGMLFLRLRLENGKTRTITILSDSVSEDTFRALSVACRWLISHNTAKAQMLEK
ncbi:MAG: flagellar hook-length control protein [Herbaspirillum sp.]|nr:flagellar hook-length control protein [Herbaspirillum sp.]